MCRKCLIDVRPDRGTMCLDDGAFVANFRSCAVCGLRAMPKVGTKTIDDENDDGVVGDETIEEVTFEHVCSTDGCGHVISSHWYKFRCDSEFMTCVMECGLCGRGADERPSRRRRAEDDMARLQDALPLDDVSVKSGNVFTNVIAMPPPPPFERDSGADTVSECRIESVDIVGAFRNMVTVGDAYASRADDSDADDWE